MGERWENMPRATSGVPDITAVSEFIYGMPQVCSVTYICPAVAASSTFSQDIRHVIFQPVYEVPGRTYAVVFTCFTLFGIVVVRVPVAF